MKAVEHYFPMVSFAPFNSLKKDFSEYLFLRVNGEELVYAHHTTLKVFKISFCLRLVVFLQWQGKEFK